MATTWDPTAKSPDVTLSNGNLTATNTGGSVDNAGRANTIMTTGAKKYWEHKVDVLSGSNGAGVANASQTWAATEYLGDSVNSTGYYQAGEVLLNNVVTHGSLPTFATGDVLCVAVDFSNGNWWCRVNGGNWWGSGTANPSTNTGGFAHSISGDVYPGYSLFIDASQGQCTANFGAKPTAFAIPSGFTTFDDALMAQAVM